MKVDFSSKYIVSKYFLIILLVIPALLATSCRSKKAVTQVIDNTKVNKEDKKQVFEAVKANRFEFEYFSAKANCIYSDTKKKLPAFNLSVRMQKDEKIWLSASVFIIEAARVLITKDSVHIINYYDKTVMSRSIDFVSQYLGTKLTIGQMQDALVGNSILEHNSNTSSYVLSDERPTITTRINQYLFNEVFHYEYFRPTYIKGNQTGSVNKIDLEYKDFKQVNNRMMPQFAKVVAVTNKNNITATLKYSDISTEEVKNWPFNIPASYERK